MSNPSLPPEVAAFGRRGTDWQAWVDALPGLRSAVMAGWQLSLDGDAMSGGCSLVHPVRTENGTRSTLKIEWPHREAEHEHLALRHWAGNGAVRLLRADPPRFVFLLERADHRRDLHALPEIEACETVARLYRRLHLPALPQLRRLSELATRWSEGLLALPVDAPLPRRYVEQAAGLARDLAGDPSCDGRLVHTDLHFGNVLASLRDGDHGDVGVGTEWLVIDPKPLSGDSHYEVAPLLHNRWPDVVATGDVRAAVQSRFLTVVDAADLDEARARDWVVVREMVNAMWALDGEDPVLNVREHVTRCVTIAKAVQD